MAEISSPEEYFVHLIPQQFAAAMEDAPADVLEQPEVTTTYEITGADGGIYGLRAAGKHIDVVPGGLETSDIHVTMTVEDWRKNIANSGYPDTFVDYIRRGKVDVVKSLNGMIRIELADADGGTWERTTIFGGQTEPEVTLRMNADEYAAMLRGDLNGQMAFLTGKLKFEGSLPLLMQMGALSA